MKSDGATQDSAVPNALGALRRHDVARVSAIGSDGNAQRMRMLGLRPGALLRVLHGPDRRGVVVQVGGARIAIGRTALEAVRVVPTLPSDDRQQP